MIYTAFIFTRQQFTTAYCLHGIPFQRRLRQGRREAHPRGVLQVLRLQRLPQECRSVHYIYRGRKNALYVVW